MKSCHTFLTPFPPTLARRGTHRNATRRDARIQIQQVPGPADKSYSYSGSVVIIKLGGLEIISFIRIKEILVT
jgi:hypothetical protein